MEAPCACEFCLDPDMTSLLAGLWEAKKDVSTEEKKDVFLICCSYVQSMISLSRHASLPCAEKARTEAWFQAALMEALRLQGRILEAGYQSLTRLPGALPDPEPRE